MCTQVTHLEDFWLRALQSLQLPQTAHAVPGFEGLGLGCFRTNFSSGASDTYSFGDGTSVDHRGTALLSRSSSMARSYQLEA